MKELRAVIDAYLEARQRPQRCALATVVRVDGSAYRRPGARMLITEEGETTGSVSGGCLEADVILRARRAMLRGETTLVTYDTTDEDDVDFGVGLGCQGVAQILIESLPEARKEAPGSRLPAPSSTTAGPSPPGAGGEAALALLAEWLERRKVGVLATVIRVEGRPCIPIGARLLLGEEGVQGEIADATLAEKVSRDARNVLLRRRSESRIYALPDGRAEVFLELLTPAVPLVLFGAGHDAEPLARLAKELGWHVTVVDRRGDDRMRNRFPAADEVILAGPEEAGERVSLEASTVAVLMTHNYRRDRSLLEFLLPSPVGYIGLLGPKSRAERLLADLREAGMVPTEAQLRRLYAPVGLDIGAETPEEIALAILAEIRAMLAGRTGGRLRDRQTPIHVAALRARSAKREARSGITARRPATAPLRASCSVLRAPVVSDVGLVILAAGASLRMGEPKQLLSFRGRSLLQHTAVEALASQCRPVVVVLGAHAKRLRAELQGLPLQAVDNPDWEEGMASSVRTGIQVLSAAEVEAAVLLVCDQPFLSSERIDQIVEAHRTLGPPIIASEYGDTVGVPALFRRALFPELLALSGGEGARRVIQAHLADTYRVPFPQGSIDVDTPQDYALLSAMISNCSGTHPAA
jgi:xanthine dehydrogenase accessory factor